MPVQILMETAKRQGKKMTTSVAGLEHFGIKLADASKVFGKKVGVEHGLGETGDDVIIQSDYNH